MCPNLPRATFFSKFRILIQLSLKSTLKKLLFLGRFITEPNMSAVVKALFRSRAASFFEADLTPIGVLPSICEALNKYDLFHYFQSWFLDSSFPSYSHWNSIVKTKIHERESREWHQFCTDHLGMHVAQECLANVSPEQFWSIADNYPDLVKCLHVQIRLAGNFGLNGGVPWLLNTEGTLCFICKENVENVNHFLLECREFLINFHSIWLNLKQKIISASPIDGPQIFYFIHHLNQRNKVLLLLGGLQLPFDRESVTLITRLICSAVNKVFHLRKEKLRELEAPWLSK